MQKIVIIIFNIILLAVYVKNIDSDYHDSWVYLLYIFLYDIFLVATLFLFGVLKIPNSLILVAIHLILQNWIVMNLSSTDIPFYGIVVNVFLIALCILSIFHQKTASFLDKF